MDFNVIYNLFGSNHPLSYLNAVLLGVLFLFARKAYKDMVEENKSQQTRINRLERSLLAAGITLLDLEE